MANLLRQGKIHLNSKWGPAFMWNVVKNCTFRSATASCLLWAWALTAQPASAVEPCIGGMAGTFPCANVDLLAHLTEADLGITAASDNWGWTDPVTGTEYALVAAREGTIFVDLSDPEAPVVVGNLPSHLGLNTLIRDLKVFADHAFIVADISGHGMQVFDLNQLRDVVSPPVTFTESAHYSGLDEAHNVAINEDTGFAYAVLTDNCSGGLDMIDISTPLAPVMAGCFSALAGIHDVQCVVYAGPDVEHQGKEVCFAADLGSPDQLAIVDVTDKGNPVLLSAVPYAGGSIAHQGWLSEDQATFLLGDEGDESSSGHNTKTYVWDVGNLDAPVVVGEFLASTGATDHNLYVRGSRIFQGNYRAGFRDLRIVEAATGTLAEVGFLDSQPGIDNTDFSGAWSVYPFFQSGIVIGTDTNQGLFVLQPTVIFVGDFEAGDTSAWSTTLGGS